MMVLLVRAARWFGWIVLVGSVGTVLAALILQVASGPVAGQSVWPSPRLWRYFFTSLGIASAATFFAAILAIPTSLALVTARRRWQRAIVAALAILPIVSMPSEHGYAWMLVATSRNAAIAALVRLFHWNTQGALPIHAAWALATWLWPIPCLVVVASFRHVGAAAYQLASMDAPRLRAFGSALSVMRGPVIAALAAVFCLSLIDSTIPPLVGMNQTWSVEMMAQAAAASKYSRPAAFLFFQAWPMLGVVGLLILAAAPGLRQMARWSDAPEYSELGSLRAEAWWPGALLAFSVSLLPFAIFCIELATGRTSPGQAMSTAIRTLWRSGLASFLVALLSGLGAVCLSIALMDEGESRRGVAGIIRRIGLFALLVTAVLPPELSGTAIVSVYANLAGPANWWSPYDRTPWPWMTGMIVRFGFIAACVGRYMVRRASAEVAAAATVDGATPLERLVHAKLPMVRGVLAVCGIIVGCLAFSEVALSLLVQPPRFFGGSLAVAVDSQMHYGRQNETIAGAILLAGPAMAVAAFVAVLSTRRGSGRRI